MNRFARMAFGFLAAISAALFLAIILLRLHSVSYTDVFMIPTGGRSAIMFTSHWGFGRPGWGELTLLNDWPDPRLGWWSGPGWENVGPFLIHWKGGGEYAHFWSRAGTYMTPKDGPGGPISYYKSYRRAEALGYPTGMAPPPQSAVVRGRELQFPFGPFIVIFAILPLIFAVPLVRKAVTFHRRRTRRAKQLCIACGYSLTGNVSGACPECGRAVG